MHFYLLITTMPFTTHPIKSEMKSQKQSAVLCPCMHTWFLILPTSSSWPWGLCVWGHGGQTPWAAFGRRRELSWVAPGDSAPSTKTSLAGCQWHASSAQIKGQRDGVPTAEQFHLLCCQCRAVCPSKMAPHTREEQTPHLLQALAPESDRKAKEYGHTNSGRT